MNAEQGAVNIHRDGMLPVMKHTVAMSSCTLRDSDYSEIGRFGYAPRPNQDGLAGTPTVRGIVNDAFSNSTNSGTDPL